ncbi:hypothetical protein Achl_4252 (plasmid) [Pseudarthrobacter chlorophenolicus A6]|uniref:Uncharacterized protein n=1 Tax=Pseudarthrobacter chlorophenolicus (strain ATCC 700700 / DSM 12829 / CIP 107037 / JCM 12360 / KCTC 9906 / NCIMB 13794 / A6) TaxID=452863 RepID=B8HIF6_PSECP|nr:hypothetical protein [Pseudarthrobacter chlorophenolicus]ACL42203.1 hypothetical protein Achl_4252 [Pseudarthrobacter chlorophenolicus A6]SDQ14828.1 hypothetical protein SAMN04489738_0310 [Pseudarthrobacter chlorophenolicus]
MDLNIVDTSYGRDPLSARLTQTAHAQIPHPGMPARHTILQVRILNTALDKNSHASVSVLNHAAMTWTELLSLPPSEWRSAVPNPTGSSAEPQAAMEELAASLFARAERILGY